MTTGKQPGSNHAEAMALLAALVESSEDAIVGKTLDGTILTVNRSFADLLGLSFADIVGRRLDEFIELSDFADRKAAQESLPRFLERRRWTGVVRAKVKRRGSTHYFDCVLHAIVRNDVVHGISGLARDITRERQNETRFTDLFETLREGVYLCSADDHITVVNPALAQMQILRWANDVSGPRQGIGALAQFADHVITLGKPGKF